MKLLILALVAIYFCAIQAAPSCTSANYCMGCHASTADKCTSCFSWASGSIKAKALNSSTYDCKTALSYTVTDAKYYDGAATTTTAASANSNYNHVMVCSKDFLNYTSASGANACSNTALTGCTKIDNCDQTVCWDASGTVTGGCRLCKKDYSQTITSSLKPGGSACASGNTITNCETQFGYYNGSTTAAVCATCKSKYAVSNGSAGCTAYTTDSNCRYLASGNTECDSCWHAYYWNTSTCKLVANILSFAMIGVAAFFFN